MITSYSTLLTALEAWNNRADLASLYPEFIGLAEAHFNREIVHPQGEVNVSQDVSTEEVALPSDFVAMKELYLDTSPVATLIPMSISALRDTYSPLDAGQPVAYALSACHIVLGPAPDTTYTLDMTYVGSLSGLSASNETNWLITAHPDLYLRAVKYYSLEYLKDEAADRELAIVDGIIRSINRAGNRRRLPAGPLTVRPTVFE